MIQRGSGDVLSVKTQTWFEYGMIVTTRFKIFQCFVNDSNWCRESSEHTCQLCQSSFESVVWPTQKKRHLQCVQRQLCWSSSTLQMGGLVFFVSFAAPLVICRVAVMEEPSSLQPQWRVRVFSFPVPRTSIVPSPLCHLCVFFGFPCP